MERASAPKETTGKALIFFTVLIFCTIYATIRYIIFKGVEIAQIPLYITNKIISWSAIIFLAISYLTGKSQSSRRIPDLAKWAGLTGYVLVVMHIIISLAILNPAYFPKFFSGETMTFSAELSILAGVMAFLAFTIPAINSVSVIRLSLHPETWQIRQKIGYYGLLATAIHNVFMGYSGWFDVNSWPGYLPPITLLSAIIAVIPLFLKILKK
ncbi:MAG: hypothetical protein U5K79_17820 [Cyclobacteriaceae bacterium]|nr:hypothetical protein [Cyclobacteriaceae bacterium]